MSTATAPSPVSADPIQEKFETTRQELTDTLIERDGEIDLALTALVCGDHLLLVGAPGTAKSMLADAIVNWMHGDKFSILLNRFTSPEELCGPVSLIGLKNDEYRRIVEGRMPTATICFLDEVFKASSAILNTTLQILNERRFRNGNDVIECPLELCIAASNEWPGDQEGGKELGALFDRFLFRKAVRPISTDRGLDRLLWSDDLSISLSTSITPLELVTARQEARALTWSQAAKDAFADIIRALRTEGISPGDRRLRKSVLAAQAFTYVSGGLQVTPDHLEILSHVLWEDPTEQPKECQKIVGKVANPQAMAINGLLSELQQVQREADPRDMRSAVPASKKMQEIVKKLKAVDQSDVPGTKANEAYEYARKTQREFKLKMVEGD